MTYEKQSPLKAPAYTPRSACQHDDYIYVGWKLPCDVKIPPSTTVKAGCSLNTLIAALELPDRPAHFAQATEAQRESAQDDGA
jgi:hypothetical protein